MIDQTVVVPAAAGLAGAIVGAIGGWLGKRAEKAPDIQSTLSAAIAQVVEHYKAALDRSDDEATEARAEAAALREEVAELRRLIEAQSIKLVKQSAEIELLVGQMGSLEQQIVALGGQPPARRPRGKAREVSA